MDKKLYYKKGSYKYQLHSAYKRQTKIRPEKNAYSDFTNLTTEGVLLIKPAYAWNGANYFPDKNWIMRGSCVHDALLQLIGLGKLDESWKDQVDRELQECCVEDGAWRWVSWCVYKAVSKFGSPRGMEDTPVRVAP